MKLSAIVIGILRRKGKIQSGNVELAEENSNTGKLEKSLLIAGILRKTGETLWKYKAGRGNIRSRKAGESIWELGNRCYLESNE
jgi:hypothetical protein